MKKRLGPRGRKGARKNRESKENGGRGFGKVKGKLRKSSNNKREVSGI